MDIKAILVTGSAYLILLILFVKTGKRNGRTRKKQKRIRRGICFLFFVNTLSVAVFIWTGQEKPVKDGKIGRNQKGGGSRSETLLVTIDGVCEKMPFRIRVDEQGYTKEEAEQILEYEAAHLEEKILGKNQDRDHVTQDLNLITSFSDYPVSVQWTLDNYQYIGLDGRLKESIPEKGAEVFLIADLKFEQEGSIMPEKRWKAKVTLYPPKLDDPVKMAEALKQLVAEENDKTREENVLHLPKEIAGRRIEWGRRAKVNGYQVMGSGILILLVVSIWKRQRINEEGRKRKEMLLRDYPEILEQISLLIGAGMTVRGAWNKIVENYQGRHGDRRRHPAYEEMLHTCFEMKGGVPEGESYENFGKRCQIQEYMRLGLLLSQNLKKGTRGIAELLSLESVHAFEDRKTRAKRKGEETGTKLLMPMVLMLAVVLIIVVVPAFWSMGI